MSPTNPATSAAPLAGDTERQTADQQAQSLALSQRPTTAVRVPGLTLIRCLGEGAYGSVWQAREKNTGKVVAVKVYSHRGVLDWSLLSREVEKLAILYTSRNVVGLQGVGWDSDPPYYVMEYLERGSLAGLLSERVLPVSESVRITKGVLRGLVHAHDNGILHCDLKPANVLLDADLEPRLCDFGQSRLSHERAPSLGTLFYMAPEQADLHAIPNARWDVYAVGAVLFHMLTGAPPHRSPTSEQQLSQAATLEERLEAYRRIVREGSRPSQALRVRGIDKRLTEIIDRCLNPDPAMRYANPQEVLDELEQRERARSFRPLLALGGLGPVLLMLALGLFYLDSMRDSVESATRNVTTRALESNSLSVEILARSVAREVAMRTAELQEIAANPNLRNAIQSAAQKDWSERDDLRLLLAQAKARAGALQDQLRLNRDRSWYLTDHRGIQRWREPEEESTLDVDFSYRNYFHGLDEQFTQETVPPGIQPIKQPHLSLPYKSKATERNVVSLTVPVWDQKQERVIGVLGRSMELGQLLAPYVPSNRHESEPDEDVDRKVLLVDERSWQLLDHPWMTSEHMDKLSDADVQKLRLSESAIALLRPAAVSKIPVVIPMRDYRDPVSQFAPDEYGGEWLIAFSRVGDTGWFAGVQERKSAALRPVDAMAARLRRDGAWALAVSGILIGTLWLVVLRGLKERSELSNLATSATLSRGNSTN
jgi:hypothetical protein